MFDLSGVRLVCAAMACLIAAIALAASPAAQAAPPAFPERSYELYQPTIRHTTIMEGKVAPGFLGDNHMASVEWFNGRFYVVWSGNPEGVIEGGMNVLSTSEDFEHWTPYSAFAVKGAENPLPAYDRPKGLTQGQPNLLNYKDQELWCLHFASSSTEPSGRGQCWLSVLGKEPGARWTNRLVMHRTRVADKYNAVVFPSQNPVLLASGRILAPVTLYCRTDERPNRLQ